MLGDQALIRFSLSMLGAGSFWYDMKEALLNWSLNIWLSFMQDTWLFCILVFIMQVAWQTGNGIRSIRICLTFPNFNVYTITRDQSLYNHTRPHKQLKIACEPLTLMNGFSMFLVGTTWSLDLFFLANFGYTDKLINHLRQIYGKTFLRAYKLYSNPFNLT